MSEFLRERRLRQMREMEALLPQVEAELKRFPNVVSVAVGAKEMKGAATEQPAFQVYVRAKKSDAVLAPADRIPDRVRGFPTDVIPIEQISPTDDTDSYRPICGGIQLQQSKGEGTLGMIAEALSGSGAPAGAAVILTNSHVAPEEGKLVGQPGEPSDCWCCECCDVGKVVRSRITSLVDGAIATINHDIRYSHEVVDIGAIRGQGASATMAAGDVVFKRGRTTGLREGRFSTNTAPPFTRGDGHTFSNQIRVTSVPGGLPFQLGGDSGSVLLDAQHRVIGLLHGASLPAGTPAMANRIEDVISVLQIKIPIMGTPGAVPLATAGAAGPRDPLEQRLGALVARYGSQEYSRELWRLVERHRNEVLHLVRHHRHARLAWHRCQGPAFASHYLKTVKEESYSVPDEIGGMRMENLVVGMAAALQRYGSPELAQAISGQYLRVLEHARSCPRVDTFLDRITGLDRMTV